MQTIAIQLSFFLSLSFHARSILNYETLNFPEHQWSDQNDLDMSRNSSMELKRGWQECPEILAALKPLIKAY